MSPDDVSTGANDVSEERSEARPSTAPGLSGYRRERSSNGLQHILDIEPRRLTPLQ